MLLGPDISPIVKGSGNKEDLNAHVCKTLYFMDVSEAAILAKSLWDNYKRLIESHVPLHIAIIAKCTHPRPPRTMLVHI